MRNAAEARPGLALDEVFAWRKMAIEVLGAADFEHAARREYHLAVRSGRAFSIIVLRPESEGAPSRERVGEVLLARARCSDVVGLMGGDGVALLLPETDGEGAWAVVDSLRTLLPAGGEGLAIQVGSRSTEESEGPVDELRRNGSRDEDSDEPPGGGAGGHPTDDAGRGETVAASVSSGRPVEDVMGLFVRSLSRTKRLVDIFVAGVLLLLLWPLFLLIGATVALTSKGGALYRQQRAGLGGRPFTFYKFRTMEQGAEENWAELIPHNEQEGPVFKIADDPRITKVGRFLRRSSLDEMPQLWNVLKGDMTLVGPRPPKVEEVAEYESWQRERLDVTGGLTCTWQVSGRSEIKFRDWMRMDVRYVRTRSAWGDVKLLLRTVGAVLSGRGAY